MGRYTGTLHKLIDNATASKKWNQVLHYIEGHTLHNHEAIPPNFESPLEKQASPSTELEEELLDCQGPKRDDHPLKIAVKAAPPQIVAALCHLSPESAKLADSRNRIPLHWACRRSSTADKDTDAVLKILIQCYPEGLLQRDDGGRTPLHWLLWYHAESRDPGIVQYFCKSLDKKAVEKISQPRVTDGGPPLPAIIRPNGKDIPAAACVIADAKHGALPLHYAVMQGASKPVLQALLQEFPDSKVVGDRLGRTALHWYLGAGHLTDSKSHVSGELNDPNAMPWWERKLSASIIGLLCSGKVARCKDSQDRQVLHWACHLLAKSLYTSNHACVNIKGLQTLIDTRVDALVDKDGAGHTPLQVFLSTVQKLQDKEFSRQAANRTTPTELDLVNGGPLRFSPPRQLIDLLIKSPDVGEDKTAATVESPNGGLPIHAALRIGMSPEIIKLLIEAHPTSLVHTTEDTLKTPLSEALSSPHTTPLQTKEIFELLLANYATSRHGTFMDGRLALKMEDASGNYPLHLACQYHASFECIKLILGKYPRAAIVPNSDGDLPVHCLLSKEFLFEPPDSGVILGATLAQSIGFLSDKEIVWQQAVQAVLRQKMELLLQPLLAEPTHLSIASSVHGLTPLHIAVAFSAVPYEKLYRLIEANPQTAQKLTTAKGYEFSCLDLHELNKKDAKDMAEWTAIEELLFAFHPTLETYRRKEELLERGVAMIRNEIRGNGSYHSEQQQIIAEQVLEQPLELSETLSAIGASPAKESKKRQKVPAKTEEAKETEDPKPKPVKKTPKPKKTKKKAPATNTVDRVEKSIYDDDDLGGGYQVSPENSEEEDSDDDFLSTDEEEEEYFTDDSSDDDQSAFDRFTAGSESFDSHQKTKTKRKNKSSRYAEEKKEDTDGGALMMRQKEGRNLLSDVAMRFWCFFLLYNNPRDPSDTYAHYAESVVEDFDLNMIESLVNLPIPEYTAEYIGASTPTVGKTLRDVASPKAKAFIESLYYFVGRYEIPHDTDTVVIHRSSDDDTIVIRAFQHILSTETYEPPTHLAPGAAEEAIWATGQKVVEEDGYMASRFRHNMRQVYFKLTRSKEAYDREVDARADLGVTTENVEVHHVVPLLAHFNANGDSKDDRRYRSDVDDQRFGAVRANAQEVVRLSDYPYAMVFPLYGEGDLLDYFYNRKLGGMEEIAKIGSEIGRSLQSIHEKAIVHGNVSMRNISKISKDTDDDSMSRSWALSDLSSAYRLQAAPSYLGELSKNGSSQFSSGLLPPEMFVKLTAEEASMYNRYWEAVESISGSVVDQDIVKPHVNPDSGSIYVIRCHYQPKDTDDIKLPKLPYKLMPARESVDIWNFGQMLFTLCSSGRQLFPTNLLTGHLIDYEAAAEWTEKSAASLVYECIEDTLAQDLLLKLLAPYEERANLSMDSIMSHAFFSRGTNGDTNAISKVVEKRKLECAAHQRWRQKVVNQKAEEEWLKRRTVQVNCWSFDTLKKIQYSTTEMTRALVGPRIATLAMPSALIILPYKLSANNKKGKLAPTTKKDVERAELMGTILLALSKACYFVSCVKETVKNSETTQWTASKLVEELSLPAEEFESLTTDISKLAAEHVEIFREDPMAVAYKLVVRRILAIRNCFEDAKKAFIYLVDEYNGVPLADRSHAPYPMEVEGPDVDRLLTKVLPFMHICCLCSRGAANGVAGLVRLIFEAAYPHVPPSWALAATGLGHGIDQDQILKETTVLQEAMATIRNDKEIRLVEELELVRRFLVKADVGKSFAGLKRVTCGGASFWTTDAGVADIQELSETYGFSEALEIQASLESKLKKQEDEIQRLKDEIEHLSFRKNLNLAPEVEQPTVETSTPEVSDADQEIEANLSEIDECTTFGSAMSMQSGKSDMVVDPVD